MIKINLLPEDMMGGKGGGGIASTESTGSVIVTLVLLVLFGANAAFGGYLLYTKSNTQARLTEAKAEAEQIKADLKETETTYRTAQADIQRMERLIDVARSLAPPNRLLWSRKLNMLPLLVPEGVFLEGIEVSQTVTERETEDSIKRRNDWMKTKRGNPPAVVRVPVYQQVLRLQGIAYVPDGTDTQRLQQFIEFVRNIQEKAVKLPFEAEPRQFMTHFNAQADFFPVSQKTIAGRNVTEFRVDLRTKPLTIR
jgi:Tfp pilus assembly protein PilN